MMSPPVDGAAIAQWSGQTVDDVHRDLRPGELARVVNALKPAA
jgi:hypothetical protein